MVVPLFITDAKARSIMRRTPVSSNRRKPSMSARTRLILHPNKPVLAAAINTPPALFAPIERPHPSAD